jgi:hypothetical protein
MKSLAGTHLIKIKNRISAQKKGGEPKPTAERLPYGESFLSEALKAGSPPETSRKSGLLQVRLAHLFAVLNIISRSASLISSNARSNSSFCFFRIIPSEPFT